MISRSSVVGEVLCSLTIDSLLLRLGLRMEITMRSSVVFKNTTCAGVCEEILIRPKINRISYIIFCLTGRGG